MAPKRPPATAPPPPAATDSKTYLVEVPYEQELIGPRLTGRTRTNVNLSRPENLSPEDVALIQADLLDAGLIGPETGFRPFVWDEVTDRAYRNLLDFAGPRKLTDRKALEELKTNPIQRSGGGGADVMQGGVFQGGTFVGGTLNLRLPDPAALDAMTDKIARSVLGRKPRDDEMAKVRTTLTDELVGQQRQVFEAEEGQRRRAFGAEEGQRMTEFEAGRGQRLVAASGRQRSGEPPIVTNLQALIAAAPGKITITDLDRTPQEQADLKRRKPNLAAAPGRSKHETGEAADLKFENKAVEKWAHQNAARFGLSFPMLGGKGKKNEPWHVELPGARGTHGWGAQVTGDGSVVEVPPTYLSGAEVPAVTVPAQEVDEAARAEQMIREANPTEAQAHDLAIQMDRMLGMLRAPVG